jgi:hypothetical protein
MNIDKKYIIIFGVSVLLIITIFGLKAYYQERESQIIPTMPSAVIFEKTFDKNYPVSLEETKSFNQMCADASVMVSKQELKSEPVLCIFTENEKYDINGGYSFVFTPLKKIPGFLQGQYIAIGINYSDLLQGNTSTVSLPNTFNVCNITKPALIDPFREELLLQDQGNINRNNIVFPEGEIFCNKFSGLPSKTLNLIISGFVPKTDLLEVKIYLVPEDAIVNNLLSQESFSSIEEILQPYSLLWSVEKQVI